jgi:hypothetical protein
MINKIKELERELEKCKERLRHMSLEYSQTREGSAYGCEYYEIQCRVLQSMIDNTAKEIIRLKKEQKLL